MKDIFKYYQSMKGLYPRNLIVLPTLLYKDNHILNLLFLFLYLFNYPKKRKKIKINKGHDHPRNTVTLLQN